VEEEISGLYGHSATRGEVQVVLTASQFHTKSQVLGIHKHEKHFKVSYKRCFTRWKF
jgi:hypothetical protein